MEAHGERDIVRASAGGANIQEQESIVITGTKAKSEHLEEDEVPLLQVFRRAAPHEHLADNVNSESNL